MRKLAREISEELSRGGVVVLPAGTVYGLFCVAADKKAVRKVYSIKGRDFRKPLQVFFPDIRSAAKYAAMDGAMMKKARKYLPGPFTLVLKLKKNRQKHFSFLKRGTIGIRVIRSRLLSALLKKNGPLAATSANVSGDKTPVKFGDISFEIRSKAALSVIDDRQVSGRASRVIDFTGEKPVVLRK